LSVNSIQSFIRSAHSKISVERRTQTVMCAMTNGFVPDVERNVDPALRLRPAVATGIVSERGSDRPK
jgi:hypothetical protein